MIKLNDKNFARAMKTPRMLVMFHAPWAGPCNLVRDVVEEVAEEFSDKATYAEFDIDDNPLTPLQYGVRAVPTFILYENGTPVAVKAGALSKEILTEMVAPPPPPVKKSTRKVKSDV